MTEQRIKTKTRERRENRRLGDFSTHPAQPYTARVAIPS